jgi:hypothetical protein
MQEIGIIKFVQIQGSHMKIYEGENRIYRPDPLLTVDKLGLTSDGIIGLASDGKEIIDVHHVEHPQSRFRGDNKISFGFVQHYHRMRERFGEHIADGVGGENIIIEASTDITTLNYQGRFFIQHQGQDTLIELTNVIPAPPCREFSIFCLQVPQCQDDIKSALQFLNDGTRGYYAELVENDSPCFVQTGDKLFVS